MQLRAAAVLVAAAMLQLHDAAADMVRLPPPLDLLCQGQTRDALKACATRNHATFESEPVPNVLLYKDARTHYVFVLADGVHAVAGMQILLDADVDVTSSEQAEVDGVSLRRVDLHASSKLARTRSDLLIRHHVLLCRREACQRLTLACSRIRDGRAVEAFVGRLVGTFPLVSAAGDRTHLSRCP